MILLDVIIKGSWVKGIQELCFLALQLFCKLTLHKNNFKKWNEIDNPNRTIFIKEIESIISNIPNQKGPSPDGFIGEFYQTFISILYNLLWKMGEGIVPTSFYEAGIILIPKPDRHYKKTTDAYLS